ncbi:MAG: FRG domain-containing protein [Candidatus Coatesbacteria bacterium]|nr:FRG domain-containing protein [Candidatus Coatesbacteria bacterium]
MQHHGLPTRLLYWTENVYYAALFIIPGGTLLKPCFQIPAMKQKWLSR